MSFAITAVVAAVGITAYSADQQRKSINAQSDAVRSQQEADARKAAEAETSAAVAANSRLAETKRRRRANALELGNPMGGADALGGAAPTTLAGGGPNAATRAAAAVVGSAPAGTALGAGGTAYRGGGRVATPRAPSRTMSA
jgi:hypothetical protein